MKFRNFFDFNASIIFIGFARACGKMASRLLVGRCVSRWLWTSTRVAVPTFRRTVSISTCYAPNKSSVWSARGNSALKRVSLLKRNYAAEGLTVEELQERLLNTIKLFDKVNPEKVGFRCLFVRILKCDDCWFAFITHTHKHTHTQTHTTPHTPRTQTQTHPHTVGAHGCTLYK